MRRKASTSFYMRRFEKLEPAPLLKGDVAVGEFDLEVGAHVAGASRARQSLAKRCSLLVEPRERRSAGSARLLLFVARRHQQGISPPERAVQSVLLKRSSAREMSVLVAVRMGCVER